MTDEDDGFIRITLRIPAALHARLNEASAKKRSMNAEIIARLESSFSASVAATTNFDAYAESLIKMTATEIAVQSVRATVAMAEALEGKSDAERRRIIREAMDVADRDHAAKPTPSPAKDRRKPE